MILIKTKKIKLGGIALFPFIILNARLSDERQKVLINHERIHIRQQIELLVLPFYILYSINYLINRVKYGSHDKAYRNIIFEREAFAQESNPNYLSNRKMWMFLNYRM